MSATTTTRTTRQFAFGIAWRAARILLIVYLVLIVAMKFLENSLIYFPMNFAEDDWAPLGIAVEDARFTAADGTKIHGWYVPHAQSAGGCLVLPRQCGQHHPPRRRTAGSA